MTEKYVTVKTQRGIYTRAAGLLARLSRKFASKITLIDEARNETVDAKSIMSVCLLGAAYNTSLLVRAEGPDEAEAVIAIADLFECRFGME